MFRVSLLVVCWYRFSRVGLCKSDSVGMLGVYVFGSLCWCVCCVGGVFILVWCVFPFFDVFCASSCSGISVPPVLYALLKGSGSSILWGSDRFVMSLSIHGAISPVSTHRRCARDISSTWR